MQISTQTDCFASRVGDEGAIRLLAEAGFAYYDFSMFTIPEPSHPLNGEGYRAYALRLRRAADAFGIRCNQSHAPFPSLLPGNDAYNRSMFPLLVRSMEVTAILGGDIVVIHPVSMNGLELETNVALYRQLLPYAHEYGVRIALENMWIWPEGSPTAQPGACGTAESFVAHLDALGCDAFTACLDIGHSEMAGAGPGAADMIRALGRRRLGALHVHDNDRLHDSHTLPFAGSIQWDPILEALRSIGYEGIFTFEADRFLMSFPQTLAVHASRLMLETGRYLTGCI